MTDMHVPDSIPRPFVAAPDVDRYFPSAVAEEVRQRLSRSIVRGEGPALLIGAGGTGKTLLLQVLAKQFAGQLQIVSLLGGQICTRRALLQSILFELGVAYEGLDEGELRLALVSHLKPERDNLRRILLLVDEADALPMRLFEELRMLSNTAHAGQPLINIVMAGNSGLEERFAEPELAGLSQRLSARCYLAPLGREETFQYVRAQTAAVDLEPETLFSRDGLEAIHAATDGLPRLINQLGDQLVWMAYGQNRAPICKQMVQEGWSEMQQLPAPWHNAPQAETPSFAGAVEFGELDSGSDEMEIADDLPASIPISSASTSEFDFTASYESGTEPAEPVSDELELASEQNAMPVARDPFAEEFGQEESVADRYVQFEMTLLSEAPKVINRLDTAFAAELDQLFSADSVVEVAAVDHPTETATLSPIEEAFLDEEDTELDPEEDLEFTVEAQCVFAEAPTEVLVIDEQSAPQAELVEGKQFRQLFSSLESLDSGAKIG